VNDLLQFGILLPNDLVELRRAHAGVLKLLERTASVDRLVLPRIADKDDPIVRTKAIEELASLLRADKTRFVNYVQLPVSTLIGGRLSQMTLKRHRFDPSLFELRRGARR